MTAIRARDVRKEFDGTVVLDGVDLDVEDDETLVLMGPNGVGKTVLLSCLAGSTTPTDGDVEAFGGEVPTPEVAFLRQEAMGIDALTGRENVSFYSRLHPEFTDRWEEYVARFGVEDALDKRLADCSVGMQRKVELAIALSIDAPVYLLDEPTAGLDLSMIQTFHEVVRERDAAFVVSSHLPHDADLADRIAFVDDGSVVATGAPDAMLDALPPVASVMGVEAGSALEEFVVDGRVFSDGGQTRGFLRDGVDVDDVAAAVDGGDSPASDRERVTESPPTYTDLFNYYLHVEGRDAG
ncbi:ABC transporter ATP-binding protein [Halomicrococcus gelatinilyticus]|uniref:ABC transporter ATP-binding protein n=1 Tax=Halomicrococcus gelatinilyticus TaxID=1702103 RepID=UPI002E0DCD82